MNQRKILKCLRWIASIFALVIIVILIGIAVLVTKVYLTFRSESSTETSKFERKRGIPAYSDKAEAKSNHREVKKSEEGIGAPQKNSNLPGTKSDLKKQYQGLTELTYIMTVPVASINLCSVDCLELEKFLMRYRAYSKGRFTIDENIEPDPAFQLAKLVNQAALGPSGRKLFGLFEQIKNNPYSIKSLGIVKFLWQIDEIKHEFEARGKKRANEADALIDRLKIAARSCETVSWGQDCHLIENEITSWIAEGALQ